MKTKMLNFHYISKRFKPGTINWQIILLTAIFFSGLIAGSYSAKDTTSFVSQKIISYYMNYIKLKYITPAFSTFLSSILLGSIFTLIAYFMGLCAVGVPFILLIPFAQGFYIGEISGYIYETFTLKGLGYCAIIIFPAAVIICASIIYASKESMLMSKNMLYLLSQRHQAVQESFRDYSVKFAIYMGIIVLGGIVETVTTRLFIGLFNFG